MTEQFIDTMVAHWKNIPMPSSAPLIAGWSQLEQATETARTQHRWQVVQLPTGTGKTAALSVLCATPKREKHPGTLIVTRFTDEANSLAIKINEISGSTMAMAAHAKAIVTADAMSKSPVLIITHEAYRSALREACDHDAASRLDLYHRYHQGSLNRPGFVGGSNS